MYRPLPDEVTISESTIEGLGLFATKDISSGHQFGISHVSDTGFDNGYIRTPLGGFVNHSNEPNCELVRKREFDSFNPPIAKNGRHLILTATRDIKVGEEITTKYSLYNFGEDNE